MPGFDAADLARLERLHPLLKQLFVEARKQTAFTIRDTNRGRADQEAAFKAKRSTVHFGDSAHNWSPSLAADIYPLPVKFDDPGYAKLFVPLQIGILKPLAAKLNIAIRQGIDWNRNGILTDDKWDDLPHVELFPWRDWAKHSQLYGA